MIKNLSTAPLAFLLVLSVLFAATPPAAAQFADGGERARFFHGDALLLGGGDGRVFLALDDFDIDLDKPDGVVDHGFLLTPAEPPPGPLFHRLRDAQVLLKDTSLRLTSAGQGLLFEFHVMSTSEAEPPPAELAEADLRGLDAAGAEVIRLAGVGLAYYAGRWQISIDDLVADGFAAAADPEFASIFNRPPSDPGDGGGGCSSGGPGSTTCSLSHPQTGGCSVTCTPPSYACCNVAAPMECTCRR